MSDDVFEAIAVTLFAVVVVAIGPMLAVLLAHYTVWLWGVL
jgi:hypothetical protein